MPIRKPTDQEVEEARAELIAIMGHPSVHPDRYDRRRSAYAYTIGFLGRSAETGDVRSYHLAMIAAANSLTGEETA